jgi:hypothetical protein
LKETHTDERLSVALLNFDPTPLAMPHDPSAIDADLDHASVSQNDLSISTQRKGKGTDQIGGEREVFGEIRVYNGFDFPFAITAAEYGQEYRRFTAISGIRPSIMNLQRGAPGREPIRYGARCPMRAT